ncbi:fasciclin-like arabinogalactan protein 3 [Musa acuminata AAA Group]|uniref:fasciclin-like arabinogalactan protein 3 n=1 Tax=Musa acuminata AAA Group TaxID=214697 RepID=UPI0031DD23BC
MASKPLPFLLLLVASAAAFDVKEILDPLPNYSAFTKYLTDLKLVDVINSRQTVTVLVVDNTAISPISSLPADKIKTAISAHILLDYYDPYIFDKNLNKSALLPTLAGGSVNFTELPGEQMVFGWAAPGAPLNSNLINVIGARPYNLSVLQISSAILPSGAGSAAPATTKPAAASPKASAAPPTTKPSDDIPEATATANTTTPAAPVAAPKAAPTTQAEAPKTSPAAPATPPKSSSTTTAALAPKSSSATAPAPTSGGATPTPSAAPKSSPAAPATTAKAPKASSTTPVGTPKASTPASSAAPKASAASPVEGPGASAAVDAPKGSAGAPAASVASASSPTAESEETSGPAGETTTPSSSAGRVVAGAALGLLMGAAVLGAI